VSRSKYRIVGTDPALPAELAVGKLVAVTALQIHPLQQTVNSSPFPGKRSFILNMQEARGICCVPQK